MNIDNFILIDFENINSSEDISYCPVENFNIMLFLGPQKKIDVEVLKSLSGRRVNFYRIEFTGKNALDFYLVFHIGKIIQKNLFSRIYIISKDKNYDSLVKNLLKENIFIKRFDSIYQFTMYFNADPIRLLEHCSEQLEIFIVKKNKTFINRKELKNFISSTFQDLLLETEISTIINILENRLGALKIYSPSKSLNNIDIPLNDQNKSKKLAELDENKEKRFLIYIERLKTSTNSRPARVTTIKNSINNWFGNTLKKEQVEKFFQELIKREIIKVYNDKIIYI
ncbi:MAG: PIN domain-containing protein [Ignavibacterium sp.]|nr:PIN domain-containing protein [Ignavibacterium sp.]MCX7612490.1 PIN domain-containing protein [Ignavibacterium sp.]MDW8374436.1 PIN domain-containing protein [Ignavibacteriales bacterium]